MPDPIMFIIIAIGIVGATVWLRFMGRAVGRDVYLEIRRLEREARERGEDGP